VVDEEYPDQLFVNGQSQAIITSASLGTITYSM
jgi:hypothetical protein